MKKTEDMIDDILNSIDDLSGIRPEDIPDIGLYMDQVTSLVDENLAQEKRYEDDKILTKTMINNYTKEHLLPPPDKKKYSRDHILIMVLIYYYKNILSIGDIEKLLEPLTENHFHTENGASLSDICSRILSLCDGQKDKLRHDVQIKLKTAKAAFGDEGSFKDPEDAEYLMKFALINELFSDIYLKKKVMEYLIDDLATEDKEKEPSAKKKK